MLTSSFQNKILLLSHFNMFDIMSRHIVSSIGTVITLVRFVADDEDERRAVVQCTVMSRTWL